ncbi:MAG: tRNA-dihydrouridine synthase [Candidatus Zambryskibacteria bacterium]|nr:tRNA-dihydrouridine synthase [Candidatus Zambryskibacteria bacterium]
MNIWQKIKKEKGRPLMVLAPMADVTDAAFRRIIAQYGTPDATWTEFVSADGLFLGGYDHLINDLRYSEIERPVIAQFFTGKPEMMEKAARLALELGFDGIDINMGCPDKGVEKQGAGAGLIKHPKLAQEIILAAMRGASKDSKSIPVSVKTRIGYNRNELETWLPAILETKPALVTVHARTRKEMSLVPARWEHVKRAVEIRNELSPETLIFGNGDVKDVPHGIALCNETGADGAMLGRAIFGNPWLFSPRGTLGVEEKLRVLVEHTKLFEEIIGPKPPVGCGKNFVVMKKHFKAYVNGFDGAKELRVELMETENATQVGEIVEVFLKSL